MNIVFDPIKEVLEEIRQGRLVIVTDDANRENEGDLILAAEKATPELINFMIRYTSGVLCVPMEGQDLDRLELPLMTVRNTESMRTAYTISVDAKDGGTGPARYACCRNRVPSLKTLCVRVMSFHSDTGREEYSAVPDTRKQLWTLPGWQAYHRPACWRR
jgi:3,4-dihydroxy 2-butanone 4-phosphate synthase / GTP cyclohydrolase II